jgi:hypothetical protein
MIAMSSDIFIIIISWSVPSSWALFLDGQNCAHNMYIYCLFILMNKYMCIELRWYQLAIIDTAIHFESVQSAV